MFDCFNEFFYGFMTYVHHKYRYFNTFPLLAGFMCIALLMVCVDCPSVKGICLGNYAFVEQCEYFFKKNFEGAYFGYFLTKLCKQVVEIMWI